MQESHKLGKRLIWPGIVTALLLAAAAQAQSPPPDVGLVTKLTGKATYRNQEEKKPGQVQAFMKVRQGDHFHLSKASSLTLLYFASGRQETWKGPIALVAGAAASTVKNGKKAATLAVKMMPPSAIKMIAAAPFPLPRSGAGPAGATQMHRTAGRAGGTPMLEKSPNSRSGAIQTMAPVCRVPTKVLNPEETRQALKKAKTIYQDLKKEAEPGDFTPELYFLGVLAEYRQYGKMNKILDQMLQQKPGDPALKKLKNWTRTQALCGG